MHPHTHNNFCTSNEHDRAVHCTIMDYSQLFIIDACVFVYIEIT